MNIQFLEDIKHKIGQYVFQRDLKHNKRHKSVCNLEDAKSIGILFEATTKEEIKEIKPLVEYFFKLKKDLNRKIKFVQDSIVAKNLSFWYKKHNIAKDNHLKIKDNGKMFAYGASARSSTLLNYANIDNQFIDFIIDQNKVVRSQTVNDLPIGRNVAETLRTLDSLQHFEQHGEVCPMDWQKGSQAMQPNASGVASWLSEKYEEENA
mgnify:CR=1 FL=1